MECRLSIKALPNSNYIIKISTRKILHRENIFVKNNRGVIMSLNQNRIVVKVGTSTLTNDIGQNNLRSFDRLSCVISDIHNLGYEIILVSSGAIAIGSNKLKMKSRPENMRLKQAAAAVGQCSIMFLYDKFFSDYDKTIAQILLNAEDIEIEEKKENLTNTFGALLEMGIIPIVNENDSVSYTEIESEDKLFGDNDMLSAVVAILCGAQKLVILSDIDGFYDSDPRLHPGAKLIKRIDTIDESIQSLAGGAGSRRGTGGMKTKLQAAQLATAQGIDTIITNGKNPEALYDIVNGKSVGTLFKGEAF
ncbi:glutamate 5-kinase [Clostridiales bacterium]|nr:glutamate 5-kinase [Clostridiales bacterium]